MLDLVSICMLLYILALGSSFFFFSSRRRHTRCALVTGVQTCALPIFGHLTLNRPDRLNSFTPQMWRELAALGASLLDDPLDLRALIVVGEEIGRASCRERVCQYV